MEIVLKDMTGRVILLRQTVGAAIPLELQIQPMVVHGNIRILCGQCVPAGSFHVRAIQADVDESAVNGSVGRHCSNHHQNPLLVKPNSSFELPWWKVTARNG